MTFHYGLQMKKSCFWAGRSFTKPSLTSRVAKSLLLARRVTVMSKLNHPPKNNSPRRISVDDLHKFVDSLPPEVRESDGDRTIILANTINAHFLGRKWCETHF